MKKYYLAFLIISTFLFVNGCAEEEVEVPQPVTTDISVISSGNLIFWIDNEDLTQKINNALTYNYGNALESEIEKILVFNSDSTQITAAINFKQEFQNNYYDPNISNNTVLINLQDNESTPIDYFDIPAYWENNLICEMNEILNSDLGSFDLNIQNFICIPVTFQIPPAISINSNIFEEVINNLNQNFFDAKISFVLHDVNTTDNNYYNLNVSNSSFNHDVINTLNVYISNSILIDGFAGTLKGLAHYPTENIDRVYVLEEFFNFNIDVQSAILTHEIGHLFSLFHTFKNWDVTCSVSVPDDGISDTPIDLFGQPLHTIGSIHYGIICNAINPNIRELIDNFMSYSMNVYNLRNCSREFTDLQNERIAFSVRHWKQNLICQSNTGQSNINLSNDINFGNTQINTTSNSQTLTISNTGNESFNITNITSSNNVFTIIGGQSITLQPNDSFDVQIQFTPTNEQDYSGVITVTNDADNANSSNSSIQVTGTGVNNTSNTSTISLSGNLNFGNVEVGQSDTRNFTISNTGNQSFNVSSISFPNGVYSSNWNSGTINAGGSQNVTVTFQPTNVQSYNGTITVNHNADGGNNTISINGSGVNNNQNVVLSYDDHLVKDGTGGGMGNSNGIAEAGEEIDLDVRLINTGNTIATNVSAILTTNDPDITITDDYEVWADIPAGATEWEDDFDFDISPNCPTKTVIFNLQITSDQGTWNDSFSINIQGTSGSNSMPITPTDLCTIPEIMQVNTEYEVTLSSSEYFNNYTTGIPIQGHSNGGNNVRGFWLAVQVPTGYYAQSISVYDVSSNFDPVIGLKSNCSFDYYPNTNNSSNYADSNGDGGNETFGTGITGPNSSNDGIYHIRIYHYNGNETPNISFKIKVE